MAAIPDYEQAGELKIGQVGIANLRVRSMDPVKIADEMRERVRSAPKLFARAAVILDFGGLSACPQAGDVRTLIIGLRDAGVLPVGIAYGTSEIESLAAAVDLPLLAKFRAAYEYGAAPAVAVGKTPPAVAQARPAATQPAPAVVAPVEPGMLQLSPVRSGQQVYATNRDLTVCATVGAGAEVIADGSIHIYGALRGRALAGAGGLSTARIFCRDFRAELVAIAGTYKVLDEVPKALLGKAVQIWLQDDTLHFEELS